MFYDEHAKEYFDTTVNVNMGNTINDFLTYLNGKKILDLGCGSGRDSKILLDKGYDVTSLDNSTQLCKLASSYIGKEVINKDIKDINYDNEFNGIYASAVLHHFTIAELPYVFRLLYDSLDYDGILYTINKYGTFKGLQGMRYFTYFYDDLVPYLIKDTKFRLINKNIIGDVMGRNDNWMTLVLKK